MRWIITEPRGVTQALCEPKRSGRFKEPKPRCLTLVYKDNRLNQTNRLDVYAEAYFARLLEVLSQDYQVLERTMGILLGKHAFSVLIADYLSRFPSQSPNIAELGRRLPVYLRSHHPFGEQFPLLSDLALLEWASIEAFYADDVFLEEKIGDMNTLAAKKWASIRFKLLPSVHLLKLSWPVDRIWKKPSCSHELRGGLGKESTLLIVWRDREQVLVERVDPLQWKILYWIKKGHSLGMISKLLTSHLRRHRVTFDIAHFISHWRSTGIITH